MSKLIINIDWVPDNFAAALEDEEIACVATGKTLEEVEQNFLDALIFHIEGLKEAGMSNLQKAKELGNPQADGLIDKYSK